MMRKNKYLFTVLTSAVILLLVSCAVSSDGFLGYDIDENVVTDNVKIKLDFKDFEIIYEDFVIGPDVAVSDVIDRFGLPEDYEWNNKGYISGNGKYRRWNLSYPNYEHSKIRIIVLSEVEYINESIQDGSGYIVGVYLESFETAKGLKVGDSLEKVKQLYGTPNNLKGNELKYSNDNSSIVITLDERREIVKYIFLDYRMQQSIQDQGQP